MGEEKKQRFNCDEFKLHVWIEWFFFFSLLLLVLLLQHVYFFSHFKVVSFEHISLMSQERNYLQFDSRNGIAAAYMCFRYLFFRYVHIAFQIVKIIKIEIVLTTEYMMARKSVSKWKLIALYKYIPNRSDSEKKY